MNGRCARKRARNATPKQNGVLNSVNHGIVMGRLNSAERAIPLPRRGTPGTPHPPIASAPIRRENSSGRNARRIVAQNLRQQTTH